METWIHDMIREHDPIDSYIETQEQLQSDYTTYCEHCDDTPLSFNDWIHSDTSDVDAFNFDDLPF